MIASRVVLLGQLLVVAALGWSAPAWAAEPSAASLLVTRSTEARDCPDTWQLAARVQALTGREILVASDSGAATSIEVDLWRSAQAYRAVIRARGNRRGTRELNDTATTCSSLAAAVTLALAMLLDQATAADARSLEKATARPRSERWLPPLALELTGGVAVGLLENPRPMLDAAARTRLAQWLRLGVGAGYVLPEDIGGDGRFVRVDLAYADLVVCVPLLAGQEGGGVELCLKPMLGALRGSAYGYRRARSETLLWQALGASVGAQGSVYGKLSWVFRTLGVASLRRHGFSVETDAGVREVFRAPALGAAVTLGLQVEL